MPLKKKLINLSVVDFGEEMCAPGHFSGPTVRSYYLIHYVQDGNGILTVKNHTWRVSAGQSFLIYPGETTFYQADYIHPWHYAWLGYTGEASSQLTQMTDFSQGQRVLSASHPEEAWKTLSQIQCDIETLHLGELALMGSLFRFLSLLSITSEKSILFTQTQYEKAMHYLQENFSRPLTVQEVADHVNLSRSQLFRIFKKAYDDSPKHVLEKIRVDHAKLLLRKTNLSIEEVANYSGFNSASYLCRTLQRYRGLSPGAYRAYWRKEKQEMNRGNPVTKESGQAVISSFESLQESEKDQDRCNNSP